MRIEKSKDLGLTLIYPEIHRDHRGTFVETFNDKFMMENGAEVKFVRDSISTSSKNVLRGIHYDDKTWKLVQCLHGNIYHVAVDLREESKTYLKWESFSLNPETGLQVLLPPRFGNGYLVLSDMCVFHYKMSEYYNPGGERICKWDDLRIGIKWPVKTPVMSEKDKRGAVKR